MKGHVSSIHVSKFGTYNVAMSIHIIFQNIVFLFYKFRVFQYGCDYVYVHVHVNTRK